MKLYGLIGFPLAHSFSKKYFTDKFQRENILESSYELFEMEDLNNLPEILKQTANLKGLNVTIPHKKNVIPYLNDLDDASAKRIGAVNTIKIYADGSTKGFNTDYYGFKQSLEEWFDRMGVSCENIKALVLGNGGAAKAVKVALEDSKIAFQVVSRQEGDDTITYEQLSKEIIESHQLIINTTPLGTFPKIDELPAIPYQFLTESNYLYDLVYNPSETAFIKKGKSQGAATMNGLKMLELQAEKAWSIWESDKSLWSV